MYENDEIEIDLSWVFEIIKKHFKPFALIILATSIVAALITLFLIPKKYTAEAKLIIVKSPIQIVNRLATMIFKHLRSW